MSYNITNWQTKKIEKFIIPLNEFFNKELNTNWMPDRIGSIDLKTKEITIQCGCDQEIKGILNGDLIEVKELNLRGEGSGILFSEILLKVFLESKGYLEAIIIWEGGDSIERLIVKDGNIIQKNVEL